MKSKILFGTAGFPPNFFKSRLGKNRDNIFIWLKELNLDAIELQCTYGLQMKEERAVKYKTLAEKNGIVMTMHAPYYICLASKNEEVVKRSKETIKKAVNLSKLLGVKRIIFHPSGGYKTRKEGIEQIINSLNEIKAGFDVGEVKVYPEIGGKVNSLGSLDEIIEICKNVDWARPCLDLAHLHAREDGSLKTKESITAVLKKVEKELGRKTLEESHFHVYPVDYSLGGEKEHKAFGDIKENAQASIFETYNGYYPKAEDYISALKEMKLQPITICEAHDTQEIGAILMKELYEA